MFKKELPILIPIAVLLFVGFANLRMIKLNAAVDIVQTEAIVQLRENTEEMPDVCTLEVIICPKEAREQDIPALIVEMALEANFDPSTALRIAKCESSFRPNEKNPESSATGLYQFIIGTWQWIGAEAAGMDRTNPVHATAMFIKYYPRYPHWWKCQ